MMSGPVADWIGGDARLDPIPLDRLDIELDAERFLALLGDFPPEQLIGYRHKIDEFEPLKRGRLPVSGRPA